MRTKILILGLVCLLLISCLLTASYLKKQRLEFVRAHQDLDPEIRETILSGMVLLGMTREQVQASRGRPLDINTDIGEWGIHEQWVYVGIEENPRMHTSRKEWRLDHFYAYIYFENGKVTSWQSR